MMDDKKIDDKIIKRLYSDDAKQIEQALTEIGEHGNSSYIPMLIDILNNVEDTLTKDKIIKILSDIKHNNAVPKLVEAIENEKYAAIQEILIQTCWESGLDYSNYFDTFIDIIINGEYMNAFEAFTLIENSTGVLSSTSAQAYIDKLSSASKNVTSEKSILIQHLINFLPQLVKQ